MLSKNNAEKWMETNFEALKNKTLNSICILGSHDSAMSYVSKLMGSGNKENTLTQNANVYTQLQRGTRYFDIRPCLQEHSKNPANEKVCCHHSSEMADCVHGAIGQSFWEGGGHDIVSNINDFISENPKELIILTITHFEVIANKPLRHDYVSKEKNDWEALHAATERLNKIIRPSMLSKSPYDTPIEELLRKGNVIILDGGKCYKNKDIAFSDGYFDEYSDTSKVDQMMKDQYAKMKEHSKKNYFILSWTLTTIGNIIKLSKDAYDKLVDIPQHMEKSNDSGFPNVLYTDNIFDCHPFNITIDINDKFSDRKKAGD